MNLQYKVVQFLSFYITKFDAMMLKTKEQYVNTSLSEKWKVRASIPLQNLLIVHDYLPIWHLDKMMLMNVVKNKMIVLRNTSFLFELFQIGHLY